MFIATLLTIGISRVDVSFFFFFYVPYKNQNILVTRIIQAVIRVHALYSVNVTRIKQSSNYENV